MAKRPRRILVVEDDTASKTVIVVTSLSHGYEVTTARDGRDALGALRAVDLPDLIVTDIMMPGMDGLTMIDFVRDHERTREIPIIILSAKSSTEDYELAARIGVANYLSKPLTAQRLITAVNDVLQAGR